MGGSRVTLNLPNKSHMKFEFLRKKAGKVQVMVNENSNMD